MQSIAAGCRHRQINNPKTITLSYCFVRSHKLSNQYVALSLTLCLIDWDWIQSIEFAKRQAPILVLSMSIPTFKALVLASHQSLAQIQIKTGHYANKQKQLKPFFSCCLQVTTICSVFKISVDLYLWVGILLDASVVYISDLSSSRFKTKLQLSYWNQSLDRA